MGEGTILVNSRRETETGEGTWSSRSWPPRTDRSEANCYARNYWHSPKAGLTIHPANRLPARALCPIVFGVRSRAEYACARVAGSLVASEVAGFAKTGGLADVAAALPRALASSATRSAIVMPFYAAVRRSGIPVERLPYSLPVPMGPKLLACRVFRATLPNSDVPVYLMEHSPYFDRDNPASGRSLYQDQLMAAVGSITPTTRSDTCLLSRAAFELIPHIGFSPDVIHANDWQTGLVPVLLSEVYRNQPGYQKLRSVFTIHNIAYQGVFNRPVMNITGLSPALYNPAQLEYNGYLSFLKGGIVFADAVTTVSPTYAREIQRAEFGYGLEGLLSLFTEAHAASSTAATTISGTRRPTAIGSPLYGRNRVREQAEVQGCAPATMLLARGAGDARTGHGGAAGEPEGDRPGAGGRTGVPRPRAVSWWSSARATRSIKLRCRHSGTGIPTGSASIWVSTMTWPTPSRPGRDLFLMPSRYEPCGLNQMYSLRYGTPPVVRSTGGLADTVVNATLENLADKRATGFTFQEYSARALYETVKWALTLYRDQPADFRQVVLTGMAQDWSWDRSAAAYEALYRRLGG